MKKIYLLLTALLLTLSANAADWYLVGANYGWDNNPLYQFSPSATDADVLTLGPIDLSGEIKIKEATTWDTSFGTNGSKLVADVAYQAVKNANNIMVDGIIKDAVVTINVRDYTITATGERSENEYDTVYLVGDFGEGWSETVPNAYPLTLAPGSETLWIGTFTLSAETNYFKMKAGQIVYSTGGNDVNVELDKPVNAYQNGNAFVLPAGVYIFNFDLARNAESGVLTVTGQADPPPAPVTSLFVLGNVNGNVWNPTMGVAMTLLDEGVFKAENIVVSAADDDNNGYFSFCTGLMESYTEGPWEVGRRFGAEADNTPVSLTETNTLLEGDYSFKIPAGTYTLTVDLNAMTLTAEGKADEVKLPETLYILGNVNGYVWNPTTGVPMLSQGNGVFKATKVEVGAADDDNNGYFSFCTELMESYTEGAWEVGKRFGAPEADTPASITEVNDIIAGDFAFSLAAGFYDFTVDLGEKTLVITVNDEPETLPETLYILGNVNGGYFSPTSGTKLEESFEGVFTLDNVRITAAEGADYGYFSFCTELMESYTEGAWEVGKRFGALTPDADPALGDATPLAASDFSFRLLPGVYNIGVDLNTMSMSVACVSVDYPATVYLLGNINAQGWNPTNGKEMTSEGNGLYTLKGFEFLPAEEGSEMAYFAFCTRLMSEYEGEGAWEVGIRYGASEPDMLIMDELPVEVVAGENSFCTAAGIKVDITLNLADSTLVVKPVNDAVSIIEEGEGEAVYINLHGIRVSEPAEGLYIRLFGDKAEKVFIRR